MVIGGLAVALATWPVTSITPTYGLDPSWRAALHLAAYDHLRFGPDLVFTHGPLGFLTLPQLYFTPTAMLAFAYVALAHLTLAVTLVHAAAKATRGWLVAMLALSALLILPQTEPSSLLTVTVLVWVIDDLAAVSPSRRLIPILIGMATGIGLLTKFNDGLAMLAAGLVLVLGNLPRYGWKPAASFVAVASVSFIGLWVLSGNQIRDMAPFIGGAIELISGYSTAMGLEIGGREWEYGAATLAGLLLLLVAQRSAETWRRHARVALLIVLVAAVFLIFKRGFVRHDTHSIGYFAVVLAMLVPLVRTPTRMGLATIGVAAASLIGATGAAPLDLVNPVPRLETLAAQIGTLTSEDARGSLIHQAQLDMREYYAFDAETLRLIRSGSVDVEPTEVGVVWAYYPTIDWDPSPVFQTYSAYTERLDNANADHLSTAKSPEWILRAADPPIDGRNRDFESPAATLAMICHYAEAHVDSSGRWQVLKRVENRCGQERGLGRFRARVGVWVEVPRAGPNELVYARVHGVRSGLAEFVRATMYRAEPVNLAERGRGSWRLVIGTAENSLVLAAPPAVGYSGAFGYPPTQTAIRIEYPGAGSAGDATVIIEFFARPLLVSP